jgi:serine/threonine protein kinase
MIAGFGCTTKMNESGLIFMDTYEQLSKIWNAPEIFELIETLEKPKNDEEDDSDDDEPLQLIEFSSDIWSLGCVFFYFETRGKHPFGVRKKAIKQNAAFGDPELLRGKLTLYVLESIKLEYIFFLF